VAPVEDENHILRPPERRKGQGFSGDAGQREIGSFHPHGYPIDFRRGEIEPINRAQGYRHFLLHGGLHLFGHFPIAPATTDEKNSKETQEERATEKGAPLSEQLRIPVHDSAGLLDVEGIMCLKMVVLLFGGNPWEAYPVPNCPTLFHLAGIGIVLSGG
jgi:hypothetical protein